MERDSDEKSVDRGMARENELIAFVKTLLAQEESHAEKRRQARAPLVVEVTLQPLDAGHNATGGLIFAVTKDISTEGIGLISRRAVTSPFMSLEFALNGINKRMIAKTVRCRPLKHYYQIAGRFVREL